MDQGDLAIVLGGIAFVFLGAMVLVVVAIGITELRDRNLTWYSGKSPQTRREDRVYKHREG